MKKDAKIYVAGHQGLVGSALMRKLKSENYTNLLTQSFNELDLRNQQTVNDFFAAEQPEYIFLAAAKVGGIKANFEYPAQFLYDNLMIEANIIHAAHTFEVRKLLFLGSSCIYPRNCAQPMKEEHLLTGTLEHTNEPYAIAKIAGIKLCQSYNREYKANFISCMPTNLYGPHDNFDLDTSHVLPALIAKFHQAKIENKNEVTLWGSGKPMREFLFVDDLADACLFLMQNYNGQDTINVGVGHDITIHDLAQLVASVVGYTGRIVYDASMPDGTPRKLLDVSKINSLGWQATTSLALGLKATYSWYLKTRAAMFTLESSSTEKTY